jgi:hypothetical protein
MYSGCCETYRPDIGLSVKKGAPLDQALAGRDTNDRELPHRLHRLRRFTGTADVLRRQVQNIAAELRPGHAFEGYHRYVVRDSMAF